MIEIPTDEELLVGIEKAIEAGTMSVSVFDAESDIDEIMALLAPVWSWS